MKSSKSRIVSRSVLHVLLFASTLLVLAPLVWMTVCAFKTEGEILQYPPTWIPASPTLENFEKVLTRYPFGHWWLNSIIAAVCATILVLVLDSLAAYAFARLEFRGNRILYFIILSMLMVPIQVTIIPLYLELAALGLIDTLIAVFLPTTAMVAGVFILRQFFRNIPIEMEEAAIIDGANRFQIWWRIVLPLSKPALVSVAIITFINSWNAFLWPLVATYSDKSRTLPVGIGQFFGGFSGSAGSAPQYGPVMAAALLATFPAIIVFLVLQGYFVRGVTMSGLKG